MTYRRNPRVVQRELAGEQLLIPLAQGSADLRSIFALNDTAAAIWRQLAQASTLAQLVQRLAADYDAPAEEIRGDVRQSLRQLEAYGLVLCDQTVAVP